MKKVRRLVVPLFIGHSSSMRMLCLPHAGGNFNSFLPWVSSLGSLCDLYSISLPGGVGRFGERPYETICDLVADLVQDIFFENLKPFIILGHSLGALVAYELAKSLQERGCKQLVHLIVSGACPPHLLRCEVPKSKLSDDELIRELVIKNGTPTNVLYNKELMSFLLPVIRSDYRLFESYEPRVTPLFCKGTVLGGLQDECVQVKNIKDWENIFDCGADVHLINGDHFFLFGDIAVKKIVGIVKIITNRYLVEVGMMTEKRC